jgi:DNA ligase 1
MSNVKILDAAPREVMLAQKYDGRRIQQFPVAVEPKLDGFRVIGLAQGDGARFFSRTGKPFPALRHLSAPVASMARRALSAARAMAADTTRDERERQLMRLYQRLLGDDVARLAIDAEVVAGSFNETAGKVRRKSQAAPDAILHIFDAIPYDAMTGALAPFDMIYEDRRTFLEFVAGFVGAGDPIRVTLSRRAGSLEEIQSFYAAFRDEGFEGAMVKPLDGLYVHGRSCAWMKMKACESENLRVVDVFEGAGKYEGQLGGLIVDRAGVRVRIGAGFTDDQRDEIWRAAQIDGIAGFPRIRGRIIEVEFHEATADGSLRHPRFSGWREEHEITEFELSRAELAA